MTHEAQVVLRKDVLHAGVLEDNTLFLLEMDANGDLVYNNEVFSDDERKELIVIGQERLTMRAKRTFRLSDTLILKTILCEHQTPAEALRRLGKLLPSRIVDNFRDILLSDEPDKRPANPEVQPSSFSCSSSSPSASFVSASSSEECGICMDNTPGLRVNCVCEKKKDAKPRHIFHASCVHDWLLSTTPRADSLCCARLVKGCENVLDLSHASFSGSKWQAWFNAVERAKLLAMGCFPCVVCANLLLFEPEVHQYEEVMCTGCDAVLCVKCRDQIHHGQSCEAARLRKVSLAENKDMLHCAHCGVPGLPEMERCCRVYCPNCGKSTCGVCKRALKGSSDTELYAHFCRDLPTDDPGKAKPCLHKEGEMHCYLWRRHADKHPVVDAKPPDIIPNDHNRTAMWLPAKLPGHGDKVSVDTPPNEQNRTAPAKLPVDNEKAPETDDLRIVCRKHCGWTGTVGEEEAHFRFMCNDGPHHTAPSPDSCAICCNALTDNCIVCEAEGQVAKDGCISITLASCGHRWHEHCIMIWMRTRDTCPLCDTKIVFSGQQRDKPPPLRNLFVPFFVPPGLLLPVETPVDPGLLLRVEAPAKPSDKLPEKLVIEAPAKPVEPESNNFADAIFMAPAIVRLPPAKPIVRGSEEEKKLSPNATAFSPGAILHRMRPKEEETEERKTQPQPKLPKKRNPRRGRH